MDIYHVKLADYFDVNFAFLSPHDTSSNRYLPRLTAGIPRYLPGQF